MVAKDYNQEIKESIKAEVGEIDTSAPFQSVKDAVSIFDEGAFSGEKPKPQSAERVLAKETKLHLAQKEWNILKEQLKNAETTKSQALLELEEAKRTVEDLTRKLKIINESKNSSIISAEAAKHRTKQKNMNLETERVEYMSMVTELDIEKQELRKTRQEYNASLEAKLVSKKQEAEAEKDVEVNTRRLSKVSEEISSVKSSIQQVKRANVQAKEDETKIRADKDEQKQLFKIKLEKSSNKLLCLKKETDSEAWKNMETRLAETLSEIKGLRTDMGSRKAYDLDSVETVTMELGGAKESLKRVAEKKTLLRSLVEKLRLELDNVKNEHSELKGKEAETESIADNLNFKLRKAKSELEEALSKEARIRSSSDQIMASIQKLETESENAKREAREMKQKSEELMLVAEATRVELEEAETKLEAAMREAEAAKWAESKALDQIKTMSEKTNAARTEPGARLTMSKDELESHNRKVEESEKLTDMRVEAAMAQVEAVKASENEVLKRLESKMKVIEDMKGEIGEALKTAEMAEAAKKMVEEELRRWHEREEKKKATETASRVLEETEKSLGPSSTHSHEINYEIGLKEPIVKERVVEMRKLGKAKTYVAKKVLRMASLRSVFGKKRNRVESGCSPSYLPGEKPVW